MLILAFQTYSRVDNIEILKCLAAFLYSSVARYFDRLSEFLWALILLPCLFSCFCARAGHFTAVSHGGMIERSEDGGRDVPLLDKPFSPSELWMTHYIWIVQDFRSASVSPVQMSLGLGIRQTNGTAGLRKGAVPSGWRSGFGFFLNGFPFLDGDILSFLA